MSVWLQGSLFAIGMCKLRERRASYLFQGKFFLLAPDRSFAFLALRFIINEAVLLGLVEPVDDFVFALFHVKPLHLPVIVETNSTHSHIARFLP